MGIMKNYYLLLTLVLLGACSTAKPPASVQDRTAMPTPVPQNLPPAVTPPLVTSPAGPVGGSLAERSDTQAFIQEMVSRHGFSSQQLYAVFSRARTQPSIIAAMNRPAEAKPWYAYREI